MLTAGVLGTVLGDDTSRALGEGGASVGLALLLSLVLFVTRGGLAFVGAYWGTVAVVRTAGTAMGTGWRKTTGSTSGRRSRRC